MSVVMQAPFILLASSSIFLFVYLLGYISCLKIFPQTFVILLKFSKIGSYIIMGSSRICLTWTKWSNYEEGAYTTLKTPCKAFIYDTLNLSI